MIKDLEVPILFEGRQYTGIKELRCSPTGGVIVSLWTTPFVAEGEQRGSYFTVIPVSGKDYRKDNPTKCGYSILEMGANTMITIYTDYGQAHKIVINDPELASILESDLNDNEIPKVSM